MSDLLAVIGPADSDAELLDELQWRHPARVTVLLAEGDSEWGLDDSPSGVARRDRLASLLHAIERRTGATVVGLAGDPDQLAGWRFDGIVRADHGAPVAA
jgi:hypothetical protein